jgi:hypothetical protein
MFLLLPNLFLMPAELAGGLALKELRYGAEFASDSPLGEKSPRWFLRPDSFTAGLGFGF